MFQRQWLFVGAVLAVAVIVYMIWGNRATVTAQTPTLSFKPTQGATGGVVSNVSDASSGYPGTEDEDTFYPD